MGFSFRDTQDSLSQTVFNMMPSAPINIFSNVGNYQINWPKAPVKSLDPQQNSLNNEYAIDFGAAQLKKLVITENKIYATG